MAWVRYESEFTSHPKVQAIPPELRAGAIALHHAAAGYCAELLTDGLVPRELVTMLARVCGIKRPRKVFESLLETRLFLTANQTEIDRYNRRFEVALQADERAFLVNDYLEYNPSRHTVTQDRAAAAERQRRKRSRQNQGVLDTGVTGERHAGTSRRDVTPDVTAVPRARTRARPTPPLKGGVGTNGHVGGDASASAGAATRNALDIATDRIRNIGTELPASHLAAELQDALGDRYTELTDDDLIELRDLHADLTRADA